MNGPNQTPNILICLRTSYINIQIKLKAFKLTKQIPKQVWMNKTIEFLNKEKKRKLIVSGTLNHVPELNKRSQLIAQTPVPYSGRPPV